MNLDFSHIGFPTLALGIGPICILVAVIRDITLPWLRIILVLYQQIIVSIFGLILITIALILYFENRTTLTPELDCSHYRLRILTPRAGEVVSSVTKVTGSFEVQPPTDSIILVNKQPEDPGYWPSSTKITVDPKQKIWIGDFFIAGNPPQKADIIVGLMKKPALILYNYYMKIGFLTGNWAPIDNFMEVIDECDRVPITRGK